MCNLYSITEGPQAIRDFVRAMRDTTGNLPPIPGVFPDYSAPIIRNATDGGRELSMARWGMPSPHVALRRRNSAPGVTNARNVTSPHWRGWLGIEGRCVIVQYNDDTSTALPGRWRGGPTPRPGAKVAS
jgi:putative SOS response-associated peptidase YedK